MRDLPERPSTDKTQVEDEAISFAREHPMATALLIVAMFGGGAAGYVYLSETLSPVRSLLGGALAGFGCWLLVMVGRVIGE